MKRAAIIFIILFLICLIAGLSQTARNPEDFSGDWYSCGNQTLYRFRDGLIYCSRENIPISDSQAISGAYAYSKHTVFLFAAGVEGLETQREVYLVKIGESSLLCENRDGTGQIFFIRYNK